MKYTIISVGTAASVNAKIRDRTEISPVIILLIALIFRAVAIPVESPSPTTMASAPITAGKNHIDANNAADPIK